MQASKKIAVVATLFTGMAAMSAAHANGATNKARHAHQDHNQRYDNGNQYNDRQYAGHYQGNRDQGNYQDDYRNGNRNDKRSQHNSKRPYRSPVQGIWKKRAYENGPIKKIVVKQLNRRGGVNKFRVNVWGDCGPQARGACFRTADVVERRNGTLKMRYAKGNRNVVLKINRDGRQLHVVRKVRRQGQVLRRTEQFLKRGRGYGHNQYGRPDLAVTYADGRWNRRLQCYEVMVTVRNVGSKMAKPSVVRAVNNDYGVRKVKKQSIGRLQPGQAQKVKLVFNQRLRGVNVEVNPGRRVQERNYGNNARYAD